MDLSPIIEVIVTVVGVLLIVVSAAVLIAHLIADVMKLFDRSTFRPESLGPWIEKLPERYFVPTVLLLLGILLADPDLFARYGAAIFGRGEGS